MFGKSFKIAYYEARMSSRGWRFWLLLALVAGISLFARRDYLLRVQSGFFLHTGFSFQHPSLWLMVAILGLGGVTLSLDVCGRLRRRQMDKIIFPLPVGSLEIMWGRFLSVLIVIIPISALGLFSLGLWQSLYGTGYIVWQPFMVAFLLVALPVIIPNAALAITARSYFKHDFAALLFGGGAAAVVIYYGQKAGILIDPMEILQQLSDSSPTLGVRIDFEKYWVQLFVHAILSVTVLTMAPLYLRRQEPNRWVKSRRWIFGLPTLMTGLTNLRFDRRMGWQYRLTLLLTLILCGSTVVWAAMRYQAILTAKGDGPNEIEKSVKFDVPSTDVDTIRYDILLAPSRTYDRLNMETKLTFVSEKEIKYFGAELDKRYHIHTAAIDGEPCSFYQRNNRVRFNFKQPVSPNTPHELTISYKGDPDFLHPDFSALQHVWYPVPWVKIQTEQTDRWLDTKEDLFEADITLHLKSGQHGAFAGDLVSVDEKAGDRIEHWKTLYPVNALQFYWGRYGIVEKEYRNYRIRFYHLPSHDYQALVYLEEVKDQQDYVHDKLGNLPFPQLTIVETPYEGRMEWQSQGTDDYGRIRRPEIRSGSQFFNTVPGTILVSENRLCYLSENMWLIERFDTDPKDVQFYQVIPYVLRTVHDEFFSNLIGTFFDQALHPSGDLAFWINDYLSSYASKLLEQNRWKQRWELNYDVGTHASRPISVARRDSLLALHQKGEYPELERVRGEALFRMLHSLLGEDRWWAMMKELFRDYQFKIIPVEDLLPLAESYYGKDLSWFVEDWVNGIAVPEYQITVAEAEILEDKNTSKVEYKTSIHVKNLGTGRMEVPIYLETEMDYIFRDLWIESGGEATLSLTVPHRPVFAMIDPENWIFQQPFKEVNSRSRSHSEKRVYIIGDENPTVLRQGNNDRGWRGRGRGGMHVRF